MSEPFLCDARRNKQAGEAEFGATPMRYEYSSTTEEIMRVLTTLPFVCAKLDVAAAWMFAARVASAIGPTSVPRLTSLRMSVAITNGQITKHIANIGSGAANHVAGQYKPCNLRTSR